MDAVNMMVQLMTQQVGSASKSSQASNEGISFGDILSEIADATITQTESGQVDTSEQGNKTILDILIQLMTQNQSDSPVDLLSQMDDDEKQELISLIEEINSLISGEITSGNNDDIIDKISELLKSHTEKTDKSEKSEKSDDVTLSDAAAAIVSVFFPENNTEVNSVTESQPEAISFIPVISEISLQVNTETVKNSSIMNVQTDKPLTDEITDINQPVTSYAEIQSKPVEQNMPLFSDLSVAKETPVVIENQEPTESVKVQDIVTRPVNIKVESNTGELAELTGVTSQQNTPFITSQEVIPETPVETPEKQITDFITDNITINTDKDITSEMVMKLKPENLGDLTIKISKTGNDVVISIAAQNETTKSLIENRLPNLIASLQENGQNAEVKVESLQQSNSQFLGSFNLNDSHAQKQFSQNFSSSYHSQGQDISGEDVKQQEQYHGEARLWQTA